jgi:AcrR family transcriptional regulator
VAQQLRGIRTREAILDAAAEAFAEHGYHGASIAEILEKAQVTRGRCTSISPPRTSWCRASSTGR